MKKQILLTLAFATLSNTCFAVTPNAIVSNKWFTVTSEQMDTYVLNPAALVGNLGSTALLGCGVWYLMDTSAPWYVKVGLPLWTVCQATALVRSGHQVYKSVRPDKHVKTQAHAQAQVPCKN